MHPERTWRRWRKKVSRKEKNQGNVERRRRRRDQQEMLLDETVRTRGIFVRSYSRKMLYDGWSS